MIIVNWQHIILDAATYSGHRVARARMAPGARAPYIYAQNSFMGSAPWRPVAGGGLPPPTIDFEGKTYIFAFWSVTAVETLPPGIQGGRDAHISERRDDPRITLDSPGVWRITAKAWYKWNLAGWGGNNAILLDMFNIDLGDFVGPDFVDVAPNNTGTLTTAANNGSIDTDTQIKKDDVEVIKARDMVDFMGFDQWIAVDALTSAGAQGRTAPFLSESEITVHFDNVMDATAFYRQKDPPPIVIEPIFNLVLGLITVGGGGVIIQPGVVPFPFPPNDPTLMQIINALNLHSVASTFSDPDLRKKLQGQALDIIRAEAEQLGKRLQ
jgi:hypothetical protein